MILHISPNTLFIKGAIEQFEKYYPKQNCFFIQVSRFDKPEDHISNGQNNVFYLPFTTLKSVRFINKYLENHTIEHLVVHYLNPTNAALAQMIAKKYKVKTYWAFFGADLYSIIPSENQPNLSLLAFCKSIPSKLHFLLLFKQNQVQSIHHFIKDLDCFCFWNDFDYQLLKDTFKTNAIHKYFIYSNAISATPLDPNTDKYKILINHASSHSGNHIKIFNKLLSLGEGIRKYELIVPLSYGEMELAESIVQTGVQAFGDKFSPILHYLPKQDYFSQISTCGIAIFGHEDQEAAGNVFFLLNQGVKIYLRSVSTLYKWLINKNFLVFSFDKDLNGIDALSLFTPAEVEHNSVVYASLFSEKATDDFMRNLIENR